MLLRGAVLSAVISLVPLSGLGCAETVRPSQAGQGALGADPLRRARIDARKTGAHLVPIDLAENKSLGIEPGGGSRSIAAGVRAVALLGGAVVAAEDRLPGSHWDVLPLPDRLGGGFLFKVNDRSIWRAEKWLGPARPFYTSNAVIARIVPGLDRVYVLAGGWHAFDGSTGEPEPLGPWPASPTVAAYAALDGWRALALADFRGVIATNDAGATWRAVPLPIEPRDVFVRGDALEVRGAEAGRGDTAYEVRADGQVSRVIDPPPRAVGESAEAGANAEPPGALGLRPLVAAIDDGWPLEDGTALVARDGALARVRLEDGAIAELAPGAFPLRPARCHPMPFGSPGQIGFLCGEPRGATVLYAFDATRGTMHEERRFDAPRAVLSSGNGGVVVHGPCDPRALGDLDPEAHHYCVRGVSGPWREIRVEGAIGRERVLVLADGRFVVVSPPQRGVDAGSLTIVDSDRARSVPIAIPGLSADVARVLAVGVWLDGVEERRSGVLGGWIEAAGTMLGFELTLEGTASFGELVRGESLLPMVSGRYGLGWSVAHGGFETTNGGMTWTAVALPEPIRPLREVTSRACGPVGCSAAGWLRVGWGSEAAPVTPATPPPRASSPRTSPALTLDCTASEPPARSELLGAAPSPAMAKDARFLTYESAEMLERAPHTGPLTRVYAWGPKSGDWEREGRWVVRWAWPFGGAGDVRSSAPAPVPAVLLDVVKGISALGLPPAYLSVAIAFGDDPSHALLVTRRGPRAPQVLFELDADRAPVEIKRADAEPLGEIESAVRESGRWYLATSARQGHTGSVVWQVDGALARELARVPRTTAPDGRLATARLATRQDGRALGLVVDGQPLSEQSGPTRWVSSIDLDTGAVGEVEILGPFDLAAQRAITLCTSDDPGFALDLGLSGNNSFPIAISSSRGAAIGGLAGAVARVRLSVGTSRACIERLSGSVGAPLEKGGPHPLSVALRASITAALTDGSSVSNGNARRVFRCGVR